MRSMLRYGCLLWGVAVLLGPAPAQGKGFNDVAKVHVSVEPSTVVRGQTATLKLTVELAEGYHTYPTVQVDPKAQSYVSSFKLANTPDYEFVGELKDPTGFVTHADPEEEIKEQREYPGKVVWERQIVIRPDAKPGKTTVQWPILQLAACDKKGCFSSGKLLPETELTISDAPPAPAPTRDVAKSEQDAPPAPVPAAAPTPRKDGTLWGLLLASVGAAIAMLFTPCVFPMIPITVSFFLKQSEKEHHKPFLTAGVYTITIIVVLALAVLVLGQLIVQLANNAWMNLGLGAVLIFFALSLFGMYEIELPHFLARFTSSREGRGGYAGTFFMAPTFTITSFTCTGPFLGPLLVGAKELQLSFDRLLLAAFAYSATFAAPFFVMALFPSLLKRLPRSGGWLNSVKVVMGFLELAAALKFLGNMDVALNPGNARLFTFETVLCAWMALSVACGLYLLGVYRLPHDSPAESIGVPRLVVATIFFGLALYMVPALFRKVPDGIIGEGLYAFLPLDTAEQAGGGGATAPAEGRLDWHLDYQKAWEQATKEGKPIFIDFTGVTCTNCRANENRIFPQKEVRDELAKFVRLQLYTDSVPVRGLSKDEALAEAERNKQLQDRMFHDVSTPLYVVFYPDKKRAFDGDKLSGAVADPARPTYSGYITDPADFVRFLKNAQQKQVAQAAR